MNDAPDKRILVVDDDEAIRVLLLTILKRRGLAADVATNGGEAIERLEHSSYAVMLLDLMMPGESGFDVLDRVGRWPERRRPITIVLTAGPEPRTLDPRLVAGTVRKPFDIDMLIDTVIACVHSTRTPLQVEDSSSATQIVN